MSFNTLLLAVQFLTALSIIVLVLLQQGKGADMGSSFGSGSAGSLFGASGAANFLSRTTKWCAVVFFATTIGLAYLSHAGHSGSNSSMMSGVMKGFEAAPGNKGGDVPATQGSEVPGASGAAVPAAGGAATPAVPSAPAAKKPDASVPSAPAAPAK
ncbi:preprotein translocase subunit SecG [Bordetella sp. FB-8]|uniref:preprotein translocase subunit SecG n=1 Tax=Bordetella sp. FB-8 TaxID=1159870 RepID=UPI00037D5C13|nr:preprotein translocase subunit SecG [Bordetella sp. FB-8]